MNKLKQCVVAGVALFGAVQAWGATELVTNGGFEEGCNPSSSGWLYKNSGTQTTSGAAATGWTLSDSAGISHADDKTWMKADYPSGSEVVCFLQSYNSGTAAVQQSITVSDAGRYTLTFDYVARGTSTTGLLLTVCVDDTSVWSTTLTKTNWVQAVQNIELASGSHTLKFVGTHSSSSSAIDNCGCIDNVSLTPASPVEVSDWATLKSKLTAGYDVKLANNVTQDSSGYVDLSGAQNVTVDLNGYTITAATTGRVFGSYGSAKLTITDSAGGGVIDGQNAERAQCGGGCIHNTGELVLEGGTIQNFRTTTHTGGAINNEGAFTMNGGAISNCTTATYGGGIYNSTKGTFTMSDGAIKNCTSSRDGGGVYNTGTVTMNGGTIENCTALQQTANDLGGGGVLNNGGTFYMNGGLITGCKATDSSASNVWNGGGGICNNAGETHIRGTISNCTARCGSGAAGHGGTIYLYDGGKIVRNYCSYYKTTSLDGAVLMGAANFTMYGGHICDNYGESTYGFTGLVMWNSGYTFTMYGGVISNNTTTSSVAVKQIGVYGGAVSLQGGVLQQEPTTTNIQGNDGTISVSSYAKVGNWYVIGTGIAYDSDIKLTGGTYTFNPTNAGYVAAGVIDASKVTATGSNTSYTLNANGAVEVSDWAILKANLQAGNSVKLTDDIASADSLVTLSAAQNVTLDLNGHSVTKTTGLGTRLFAIQSSSVLTIKDSGGTGKFCTNGTAYNWGGGALAHVYQASLVIEGGTFDGFTCDCTTEGGGCIRVVDGGVLTMKGGTIKNCWATYGGGAVYVAAGGTFTMDDGTIENCGGASYGNGGGICNNGGTVNMKGGLIAGCAASDRGGAIQNVAGYTHIYGCISNCTARCAGGVSGSGGTVYLYDGGEIVKCHCSHATLTDFDGSAALFHGGNFEMHGGRICDNYGKSVRGFTGVVMWGSGNTFTMYGGVIGNNTTDSSVAVKQIGVYDGAVSLQGGILEQEPTTTNIQGHSGTISVSSYAKVGNWYVIGTGIAYDLDNKLTGGTYTFNPTSAEYVAAGVVDASKVTATGSNTSYTLNANGAVEANAWAQVKANLEAGNSVKLTADITETTVQPVLANNQQVTLDLNGHTITQRAGYWVFELNSADCKVTVKDSATSGKIIGSGTATAADGGGMRLASGEFILESGTISGFQSTTCGGFAYVVTGAKFTMNGGTITNCSAKAKGGAICNNGTFTLNGGAITDCKMPEYADNAYGGGVYNTGTFTMNGGAIRNCRSERGVAGGVYNGGMMTMRGGEITGCTLGTSADWGTAIDVWEGSTFEMYGGTITNNTPSSAYGGAIEIDGTMKMYGGTVCEKDGTYALNGGGTCAIYGGYVGGAVNLTGSAAVYGAVGSNESVGTKKAAGTVCVLVGDNYVVGQSVAQADGQLTAGTYTFCPTNAEYVAVGLEVADGKVVSENRSMDATWVIVDYGTKADDLPTTAGSILTNGKVYDVTADTTITSTTAGGNALTVADNATVTINIAKNCTLTVKGGDASGRTGGGAGIYVPSTATLIITGEGTLNATGGNGTYGSKGSNGDTATQTVDSWAGDGGAGGNGGGGAGAGIGGSGGVGGSGGALVYGQGEHWSVQANGRNGNAGGAGGNGSGMGNVYVVNTVKVVATGGTASTYQESSAVGGGSYHVDNTYLGDAYHTYGNYYLSSGGGGAGGNGGNGSQAVAIGGGGYGAGGAGSGGGGGKDKHMNDPSYSDWWNARLCHGADGKGGLGSTNGRDGSGSTWDKGSVWATYGSGSDSYWTYKGGAAGASGAAGTAGGDGTLYAMSSASVTQQTASRSVTELTTPPSAIKVTLTLQSMGSVVGSIESYYGCALEQVSVPVRDGYLFAGYFTATEGGTQIFDGSGNPCTVCQSVFDETLYAQWEGPLIPAGDDVAAHITNGVCTIYGTGEMTQSAALAAQLENVKEVRITDGVTGVGTYFFDEFYYLTNVTVAASCTSLGKGAFYRCFSLEQITFEGAMPEGSANAIIITAGIKMVDDEPVVYAVPNVTVNGKSMTLKGSNDLKNWEDVTSGNEKNYHFFKFVAE